MSALAARTGLENATATNASGEAALLALFDFVAQRLAAGTAGAGAASAAELLLARNSLGLGAGADVASAATLNLTGRNGNIVDVTGMVESTAITLEIGGMVVTVAVAAWPINVAGVLVYTCAAGDMVLWIKDLAGTLRALVIRKNGLARISPRSFYGLTMSTAGSSTTMTVGAGESSDSTNTNLLVLASSMGKTTSAWAAGTGNGGLDAGTIANNSCYHHYLISRPDTGAVDVIFSLSASAPTLPANYTQYAYIEAGFTNGSGQWTKFVDAAGYMLWDVAVADVSASNFGTSAVSRTLTVPTGRVVSALMIASLQNNDAGADCLGLLSPLAVSDQAPSSTLSNLSVTRNTACYTYISGGQLEVATNTSAQIRSRLSYNSAGVTLRVSTLGWKRYGA